jgi:hypothetical protein
MTVFGLISPTYLRRFLGKKLSTQTPPPAASPLGKGMLEGVTIVGKKLPENLLSR